jgi:hypothetical protein
MVWRGRRFGLAVVITVVALVCAPSVLQAAPVSPDWWVLLRDLVRQASPVSPSLKVCDGVTTDPNGCPKAARPKERPPADPSFAARPNT